MIKFFEILPATLSWFTLILMFLVSWKAAFWAAIFIILFDTYWLLKTLYLSLHLRHAFNKMRENEKINWLKQLNELNPSTSSGPSWQDVYHLVILPMYNEPYEVVRDSFESLIKINYPKEKMIVVLATEERAGEKSREIAKKIEAEFGNKFYKF